MPKKSTKASRTPKRAKRQETTTKRGRKAKPKATAIKAKPLTSVPVPPKYLGEIAQEYWQKLAPQLIDSQILTEMHLETFAVLCDTYETYRVYTDWINKNPDKCIFEAKTGYMVEAPQVRLQAASIKLLGSLWMKFGLTPDALAKLKKQGGSRSGTLPVIHAFAKSKYSDDE